MSMVQFLIFAIVVMVICLGGIGGWLLPQLGIHGMAATAIAGGLGGAIMAVVYQKKVRKADGA